MQIGIRAYREVTNVATCVRILSPFNVLEIHVYPKKANLVFLVLIFSLFGTGCDSPSIDANAKGSSEQCA